MAEDLVGYSGFQVENAGLSDRSEGTTQINFRKVRLPQFGDNEVGLRHYFPDEIDFSGPERFKSSKVFTSLLEALSLSQITRDDGIKIPRLLGFGRNISSQHAVIQAVNATSLNDDLATNLASLMSQNSGFEPINVVDIVPLGSSSDNTPRPGHFYRSGFMMETAPMAYLQGLKNALQYLKESHKVGFWPVDTKANDPFLVSLEGAISIVDTGSSRLIDNSRAFDQTKSIYRNAIGKLKQTRMRALPPFQVGVPRNERVRLHEALLHEESENEEALQQLLRNEKKVIPTISLSHLASWLTDTGILDFVEPLKSRGAEDMKRNIEICSRLPKEKLDQDSFYRPSEDLNCLIRDIR